jgi:hypothetical protein
MGADAEQAFDLIRVICVSLRLLSLKFDLQSGMSFDNEPHKRRT